METLDISMCRNLTEKTGTFIAENCPNLKTLKAAYCLLIINDSTLKSITSNCKQLSSLDISYCKDLTDEGLDALAQSKQSYQELLINGLGNISSIGVIGILRNSYDTLKILEMALMDCVIFIISLDQI